MGNKIAVRELMIFNGNVGWRYGNQLYKLVVGPKTVEAPDGTLLSAFLTGGDWEPKDDHIYIYCRSEEEALALPPHGPEDANIMELAGTLFGMVCFRVSEHPIHPPWDGYATARSAYWKAILLN